MFSRDPTELTRKEKMSPEEVTRSIRLDLAAELDAVNFYEQQASLFPDGSFKKVHEDIAREEVAHFGEFMRLLYENNPDEFESVKEGWEEASALIGNRSAEKLEELTRGVTGMNDEGKRENVLEGFEEFRTVEWKDNGIPLPEDQTKIIPFRRIVHEFSLGKKSVDIYRDEGRKANMEIFQRMLAKELIVDHELSVLKRSEKGKTGDWSQSGGVLGDALNAREKLVGAGYLGKPLILISGKVLRLLLRQSGDTGQTELDLIREAVGKVEVSYFLDGFRMLVMIPEKFWILVKSTPEIRHISETADLDNYVAEAKVAPLLYDRDASILMDWKR